MSTGRDLPPETIERILHLQPAKSLGRFKCVSKSWLSLISNSKFIKTHVNRHPNSTKLLLISYLKSLFSVDLNQLHQSLDITVAGKELIFPPLSVKWEEICGSCDGLILAKDHDRSMFILNPTTQESSKLPVSPFALPLHESHVMYGFGYDASTDDYKVVTISFWDTDNEHNPDCTDMFVNVYSLKNDSWRKLNNSPYDHAVGHLVSGVLLNGHLHWLTSRITDYSSTICAFSLADEEFKEIELPESIDNDKAVFNKIGIIGEKLVVFGYLLGNHIWVMTEYGKFEFWIKILIDGVEIDPVKHLYSIGDGHRSILLGDDGEVIVYDGEERSCFKVMMDGVEDGLNIGHTYVESLISPKCIKGTL